MQRDYDALVIGAGPNGLALGCYLARSGLEVVVLERRHEEGGSLCTEELTLPGFLHNVSANCHTFFDLAPPLFDLELGMDSLILQPEVQLASVFPDGTALTLHADDARSCASIARLDRSDAETYRQLREEAKTYGKLMLKLWYRPTVDSGDALVRIDSLSRERRWEFLRSELAEETIDSFLTRRFRDERVRAHLAFTAALAGYAIDVPGLALVLPLVVALHGTWGLVSGGSNRLAHRLWRDLARHNGVLLTGEAVNRILVEHGRAVGAVLADGTEVRARRFVVSAVDQEQTLRLLGFDELEFAEQEPAGDEQSFFSVHLALQEAPEYEAARFDPDANRAWIVNLGYASLGDLHAERADLRAGKCPEPRPHAIVNTLYDRSDAPEKCYTGLLRQFVPLKLADSEVSWESAGVGFGRRCLDTWESRSNLRAMRIMDSAVITPLELSQKFTAPNDRSGGAIGTKASLERLSTSAVGRYRTFIEHLYLANTSQHAPHESPSFAPAYNALQVIAADQGIDPWWQRDRRE